MPTLDWLTRAEDLKATQEIAALVDVYRREVAIP